MFELRILIQGIPPLVWVFSVTLWENTFSYKHTPSSPGTYTFFVCESMCVCVCVCVLVRGGGSKRTDALYILDKYM